MTSMLTRAVPTTSLPQALLNAGRRSQAGLTGFSSLITVAMNRTSATSLTRVNSTDWKMEEEVRECWRQEHIGEAASYAAHKSFDE